MSVSKPGGLGWFRDGPAGLLNQPVVGGGSLQSVGGGVAVAFVRLVVEGARLGLFCWLRSERSERLETWRVGLVSRRPCGPPQPAGGWWRVSSTSRWWGGGLVSRRPCGPPQPAGGWVGEEVQAPRRRRASDGSTAWCSWLAAARTCAVSSTRSAPVSPSRAATAERPLWRPNLRERSAPTSSGA